MEPEMYGGGLSFHFISAPTPPPLLTPPKYIFVPNIRCGGETVVTKTCGSSEAVSIT